MGKHNRYAPQPQLQPLPKPLSPPPAPPIVDEEDEIVSSDGDSMVAAEGPIPGMQKRPARIFAVGRVRYTGKDGTALDAYDGEELIDPLDTDVASLRALGAITENDPNKAPAFVDAAGDEGLEGL